MLEIRNISKSFPGVRALTNVTFLVDSSEIHALVGENGAGKSTLMKILAGIYKPDVGEVYFNEKLFTPQNPRDALNKGISMVHQELDLIPEMTISENVFAGNEMQRLIFLDRKSMYDKTQQIINNLGLTLDPDSKIKSLSTAQQQMVAIMRAIAFDAQLIIMDEPTSAITDKEIEKLFEIIRKLKSQGKSIIYISHKMDEIFELTDKITVLRDGEFIDTVVTESISSDRLINLMVGRELKEIFPKTIQTASDQFSKILEVKNLSKKTEYKDINFDVYKGEILGVFGLMGAGRTELMDSIFGVTKQDSGQVFYKGKEIKSISDSISDGIAYITEDRKLTGLNLIASVKDNITSVYLDEFVKYGVISNSSEKKVVDDVVSKFRIKCPNINTIANTLSGGNQQKIVLAKWFVGDPDLIIMDEPTRGIDIGSKSEIYRFMSGIVELGKSIIMISSETPELLGMSNRIIVMHEGIITGKLKNIDVDQDELMAYAIGEKSDN